MWHNRPQQFGMNTTLRNFLGLDDRVGSSQARQFGSTIGQPADLHRSRFGLWSRPLAAVESGKVIKRDQ